MVMDLTDTEEGTPVMDITDEQIGVVTRVEDGTVYIEYVPDVAEQLRTTLDPSAPAPDTYPLHEDMVDHVTEEFIRVRGDHLAD
jgi:hypothetical protein